jgi:hypothetical protein
MLRGEQRRVPTPGVNQRINTFTNPALALQEEAPSYPQEEEKPRIQGAPKTAAKVHKEAQTIYKRIILIMDNATIHRSRETRQFLEKHAEKITPLSAEVRPAAQRG